MALFDLPKRADKANDAIIAKKSKVATKSAAVKIGGGLLGRLNEIKDDVEKNLGKFKDEYVIIQDATTYRAYIDICLADRIIAIDTETTGLDPMQDTLVGVCLYSPSNRAAYIPINHVSYITGERLDNQLSADVVAAELKRIAEANIKVIMFNANFDIRVLRNQLGVYLTCYWDCYLAARLMNENEGEGNNGLKQLHRKYVLDGKEDAFSFDELFKGITFDKVPINYAYLYAAHDAIITYELYEFQKQYVYYEPQCSMNDRNGMNGVSWVFFNIEMPCVSVVCDMEDTGVLLDMEYARKLSVKYNALMEEKKDAFYSVCGQYSAKIDAYKARHADHKLDTPVNIASTLQISTLLYDILQLESPDAKNPRGTGEVILSKLNHPICDAVLEYRNVSKLVRTYIDKLPEWVNPKDGRIHCNFNQYGADTGRFSSDRPNLQNIPSHNKDIRKMFIASPGCVLMSADYSQQEPKVMTQMCGDEKMLKAYKEGKDLYAEIAALSFNTTYENCLEFRPDGTTNPEGKARRSQAKSILLGVLYGRGVPSIAEQLGTTTEKAQRIKDSVFKGFPAIPKFEEDSLEMAYECGYVTTLWGRKRRLPDLQLDEYEFKWKDGVAKGGDDVLDFDDTNESGDVEVPIDRQKYYLRKLSQCRFGQKRKVFEEANKEGIWIIDNGAKIAESQRQCVNARIQGSAADMSKLAMILVGKDEQLKNWGFKLLIPVHDELIGECPIEHAKECADRFSRLMSEAAESKLTIPIKCDVEITKEWYGESIKL